MNRPSVWDNSTCSCDTFRKDQQIPNVYSAAVINEFTIRKFKEFGLQFEIFDYFGLAVHRNNEFIDTDHYLYEWLGSLLGTVGYLVTDVLLTQLCPNV